MVNFDFKRSNHKCSISGRAFDVGEEFHSMLITENDDLVRRDVGEDLWNGPPDNCVGWWKSRVPDLEQGRIYWAPREVLMAYFQYLVDRPEFSEEAYVMAILLLQKKHLSILDTLDRDGKEFMLLVSPSTKVQYEVAAAEITDQRIDGIQQKLAESLFTNFVPTDDSTTDDSPPEA